MYNQAFRHETSPAACPALRSDYTHSHSLHRYLSVTKLFSHFIQRGKTDLFDFRFVLFSRKAVTDDGKRIFLFPRWRLFRDFSPELWRIGG